MQDTPSFSISDPLVGSIFTPEDRVETQITKNEQRSCSAVSTRPTATAVQTTCGQDESPKWLAPRLNYSVLQALPTELLIEIFKYLGWEDVLAVRRTCKFFLDISTSRPLWVCLFYRLSSEVRVPPILERPISAYTAAELEYVVMRRISSEIRWATGALPRISTFPTPDLTFEDDDEIQLLDGGRWLLTCTRHNYGRVYCYDLDMPLSQEPRCIIDLEIDDRTGPPWLMATDVDKNAKPELIFNLCLAPRSTLPPLDSPSDWTPEESHFYRLIIRGHGTEAILEAHKLKSLRNDIQAKTEEVDFYGNYLVKSLDDMDPPFYLFEVCNWIISDSAICFKGYIEGDNDSDTLDDVLAIPNDKLVVISNSDISLYNISNLRRMPAGKTDEFLMLQPYWKLANISLGRQVDYFKPNLDSQASRAAFIMDDVVYGLTIPHDSRSTPYLQAISDVDVTDLTLACVGISKMYAHESDEEGWFRTLNLQWPDDKDRAQEGSSLLPTGNLPSQHRCHLPYAWDEAPIFDESSNRIFSFAHKSWVVLDFAYK